MTDQQFRDEIHADLSKLFNIVLEGINNVKAKVEYYLQNKTAESPAAIPGNTTHIVYPGDTILIQQLQPLAKESTPVVESEGEKSGAGDIVTSPSEFAQVLKNE